MRFSSSVHDRHRRTNPPARPWSWSLSLDGLHIDEGTAATAGDADAAVDAKIDELAESLRMARRQQSLLGVKL